MDHCRDPPRPRAAIVGHSRMTFSAPFFCLVSRPSFFMPFPSKCPNNGQKGAKSAHFGGNFRCFRPPFSETPKPRLDHAGVDGFHVRPSGMTTFFGLCFVDSAISSQTLLRGNIFMDFVVFGAKWCPKGDHGAGQRTMFFVTFRHFSHLAAEMPPQWRPGGAKVTKLVPKVSKIPPKWTPKQQKQSQKAIDFP